MMDNINLSTIVRRDIEKILAIAECLQMYLPGSSILPEIDWEEIRSVYELGL